MDNQRVRPVVVGFDGSDNAGAALAWARAEAASTSRALRVVVARGDLHRVSRWADEWTRELAEEWSTRARERLAAYAEDAAAAAEVGADAEVVVRDGNAAPVLVDESAGAHVLVVGSSGHGSFAGWAEGSVVGHVVRQAACATVVARPSPRREAGALDGMVERIVVGVDGSPQGLAAVTFACERALRRGATVRVVHVPEHRAPYGGSRPLRDDAELVLTHVEEGVLADAAATARAMGVEAQVDRVRGRPRPVLVDASRAADLVVVGSRGCGAFAGLLLGSVSAHLVHHGRCSVAVVR